MTREDRLQLINHLKYNRSIGADYLITDNDADEIIKALEQEPCEDCVSRQAVIDMTGLSEWFDSSDSYNEFVIALSKLTPVTPIYRDRTVQDFVDRCRECGREKVIDKIRAEIEQKRIGYPPNAEYYWAIKECLQIIDKYKAEMESEE